VGREVADGYEEGRIASNAVFEIVHDRVLVKEGKADSNGRAVLLPGQTPDGHVLIFEIIQPILKAVELDIDHVLSILVQTIAMGCELLDDRNRVNENEFLGPRIKQNGACEIDGALLPADRRGNRVAEIAVMNV